MSLCDSDLFMQTYIASHRKLSDCSHSAAVSYYSGTESQQSLSDRSFYDNVDVDSEPRVKIVESNSSKFLLPPQLVSKISPVNRSKSFQETGHTQNHLSPRFNVLLRRNRRESSSIQERFEIISNRSSESPVGSTLSERKVACSHSDQNCKIVPPTCSCCKKSNDPFYVKIIRRMQKLSLQWRKCKKVSRGRSQIE